MAEPGGRMWLCTHLRWPSRVLSAWDVFFFQAEGGIRCLTVPGVQTCALPIYLIKFIRTFSEMFYRQTLTDYARLELIKVAFPRQDLLKWFDSRAVFPIPPERYMLLLFLDRKSVV